MTASFEGRSAAVTASPGQMDGFPILPEPRHPAGGINMGWDGTGWDGMRCLSFLYPAAALSHCLDHCPEVQWGRVRLWDYLGVLGKWGVREV